MCKYREFHDKVLAAWDSAHLDVPLPGTEGGAPLLAAGGMDDLVVFSFQPAVFDVFGGCSDGDGLFSSYVEKGATRQGSSAKSVLNIEYTKISYCTWSANAQAIIMGRPS